jgi:hypothetical protein
MSSHLDKDLFGETIDPSAKRSTLHGRFLIPPFTTLNTREGSWQERKRGWFSLGIKSEEGRSDDLAYGAAKGEDIVSKRIMQAGGGTSIFDPTLCEVLYTWFASNKGMILDPFAGGSVRGIVAAELGYEYTGIELRPEQVAANIKQGDEICTDHKPLWLQGDSNKMDEILPDGFKADFIFSCPPYGDLEVYSDMPEDISNKKYPVFIEAYTEIIKKACAKLKPNRFAAFVVANFRDKNGNYNDFVGDTVRAFKAGGLHYYNEGILLNAIGSLPLRVSRQFDSGRKLGKAHQNVLVFVKGDAKIATAKAKEGNDE